MLKQISTRNLLHKRLAWSLLAALVLCIPIGSVALPHLARGEEANTSTSDLEKQIREKQQQIEELERQQRVYESTLSQKKQESLSLQNQLAILDTQIAGTDVDIRKLQFQIESLDLEIQELTLKIEVKEFEERQTKDRLAELLRLLNRYNNKTLLEVFFSTDSFATFLQQMKYLETVEEQAKHSLDDLIALKEDMQREHADQEAKLTAQKEKKAQLDTQKNNLVSQQSYREKLLQETEESEEKYQALLDQARQEQLSANADIQNLEVEIRKRLAENGELPDSTGEFIWPVPSRRVTAYFHDPSYPFRRVFEHPAIDIGTPQGTPVRAIASGFVGRAKDAGLGYSYIMLLHGNDLSSVYGHISHISVVEGDFVVQGQVIGYSGGTPGTPGAGRLTTGPHLHLEVRKAGFPVDPLNYLP